MAPFHILRTEWFHSVFGSKNRVVLFFVWFQSLSGMEPFHPMFGWRIVGSRILLRAGRTTRPQGLDSPLDPKTLLSKIG